MKRALVVGCAQDVLREVEEAKKLCKFDAIYCVKMAGIYWKGERFSWVTLHPEFMADYRAQRKLVGLGTDYEIVAPPPDEVGMHGKHHADRRVSYRWPGQVELASASSGGYGAKVALDDGADRVVLAGVPMTPEGKHFVRGKFWMDSAAFVPGFQKSVPHFAGRVRSMSGWTQEILGVPTPEWLAG